MSNIQRQHKISPAIAWLTIQKFIIFYCPLDGEHTIPLAALFFAYLTVGASTMASNTDIPKELITVIQAIMIMLVSADALLKGIKQKQIIKEALANENAS